MKINVVLIATFCLFSVPYTAYACSCGTGSPAVEFNKAKTVFIGRMLGGTEQLTINDRDGKSHSIEAGKARFTVEDVFKGDVKGEVTIQIASHKNTSCGPYGLKRGEQYIVYAYGGEADQEILYSGVCTRTTLANQNDAKEDLNFLRNLPPAGTGGNLRGSIWADLRGGGATPLPNVNFKIRGADNQVIIATTDKKGKFELKNLKAGKYRVEPEAPAHYQIEREHAEVTIDDLGTAEVGFEAYLDGRVSGRMIDKDGRGFNSIFLHLEAEGKRVNGHSTGEDGWFKADGVPPGEYVLYLEMHGDHYSKNRNFYYPGTFKREEAEVIKVELGGRVEDLEFLLPEEYKVRTIEGQVVWKDGKPAADAEVMLLCPQSAKQDGFRVEFSPTRTVTDEQGRFRLEGFTGEVYWLEARGRIKWDEDGIPTGVHSPSNKIILNESLKGVRVVLSEQGFFGSGCGK
jgi:hypothetical protein